MKNIFLSYGALITPLGNTVDANFEAMKRGVCGIKNVGDSGFNKEKWPLGKINSIEGENRYTELLNRLCEALLAEHPATLFQAQSTLLIVSSTKADINLLPDDTFASTRSILHEKLKLKNDALIISNACISGVLAINTAADYINSGKYKTAIVIGIDALSDFIVYGFQSLFALSSQVSKPFDKNRQGISIGEAAGAIIVSSEKLNDTSFYVNYLGGSSSNDANHISGPSRTGEGLYRSVTKTLNRSNVSPENIDFISAHGTGTAYNDEMESIAFDRLQLNDTPLNSFKGYFGHTLGAAGIIELIMTMSMMENNLMLKSMGFDTLGLSKELNVLTHNCEKAINIALKTASGFGGGNASVLIKKAT